MNIDLLWIRIKYQNLQPWHRKMFYINWWCLNGQSARRQGRLVSGEVNVVCRYTCVRRKVYRTWLTDISTADQTNDQHQANVRRDDVPVRSSQLRVVDTASNLSVVVDSQLSMYAQVAAVCCGGYYQLRQLRPLKRCMTDEAINTVTHAFTSSRLDYCNVLYCGIAEGLLSRLQWDQNAAARFVTDLGRWEHITPDLQQLQWLPVRQRVFSSRRRWSTTRLQELHRPTCATSVTLFCD